MPFCSLTLFILSKLTGDYKCMSILRSLACILQRPINKHNTIIHIRRPMSYSAGLNGRFASETKVAMGACLDSMQIN